jgi:hypothetical protein
MMSVMAEGDAVAGLGVRVRLDGRAHRSDVSALKAWLEREEVLRGAVDEGALTIEEQVSADGPDGHMGADYEIVLLITGTLLNVAQLAEYTARAVKAWRDNRRRVESGEPPETRVDRLDRDGE